MTQGKIDKWMIYATQIKRQVDEILTGDESVNAIDLEELGENNNAAHFFHAFTVVGCLYYKQFTRGEIDYLEFNHVANRLCFQFGEFDEI